MHRFITINFRGQDDDGDHDNDQPRANQEIDRIPVAGSPAILKQLDPADKAMDKKSALLQFLYRRLREKLGMAPPAGTLPTRGFKTYEFAYREAIYGLALAHAKEPFYYQKLVDRFLAKAL